MQYGVLAATLAAVFAAVPAVAQQLWAPLPHPTDSGKPVIFDPQFAAEAVAKSSSANTSAASLAFVGQTSIAVQETITLQTASNYNGWDTLALDSFDANFYEQAPEPSTLLLLGSAMAGVAVLRRRRKKA